MSKPQEKFDALIAQFEIENKVTQGKMMTAPALKFNNKVFAFFHKETMGFKLGKDFDPAVYGLTDWDYLSPFKNKPPMKAWFIIPAFHIDKWEALTVFALTKMKNQ